MDPLETLREIPEKRLRIFALAWQVTREDGSLDREKAAFLKQELEAAFSQAEAYHQETMSAVLCLQQLTRP